MSKKEYTFPPFDFIRFAWKSVGGLLVITAGFIVFKALIKYVM